ncbi:carnitine dehydratase [Pollutimonas nitritireducens]|uniref:Carnitine dehydratase n=1 Tax=Pollutimonas nitritireducens TaxID=2045209 RepID=A0A2N4UI08_9BURK|nr:CoA transferase [Pollutimonas nitritireducens]PLC54664.1 carnitine dehydratase [Pollutimonas nitritireducens]
MEPCEQPPHSAADTLELPYRDLTVLELGHSVAAPFAGQILADLGARVVKVEKPSGDDARGWGPPFIDETSAIFQALNRNKQSIICSLRDADQVDALIHFIDAEVDVVIQNLRPGQVDDLGLDAKSLRARKASLVYCNMGAFGSKGPLKDRPGYDPLMQAFGGIMSTTGEEGRPSVRVASSIVDMGTGMWAVIAILSALQSRVATGQGSLVDVSLFETSATWMSIIAAQASVTGISPGRYGSGAASIVPYKAYTTTDGEVVVAAGSDSLFRKLAVALSRAEWADDKRFCDNPARVLHQAELYGLLDPIFATKSTSEWMASMEAAGIPAAPVNTVMQMLEHPQTAALGLIQTLPGCSMPVLGLPISYDGHRPVPRSASPVLGADTSSILDPYLSILQVRNNVPS